MKYKNNPGNLRYSPRNLWRGQEEPLDGFCCFTSMHYGLRALVKTLLSYERKYGVSSLGECIARYAPPSENDTDGYVSFVVDYLASRGFEPSKLFPLQRNVSASVNFVAAICRIETGYYLSAEDEKDVRTFFFTL